MGSKKVLPVFQLITDGVMSGTNTLTSNTVNIQNLDNIGLQVSWSGTPTGTLSINCSIDNVNFDALTFNPPIAQPLGSPDQYLIDLNQVPFPYLQVSYTNASGSGTLEVFIFAKDLN